MKNVKFFMYVATYKRFIYIYNILYSTKLSIFKKDLNTNIQKYIQKYMLQI